MTKDLTRTTRAFPDDLLRTHLAKLMSSHPTAALPFQFGQVIQTDEATNRLKVRIPLIDDILDDDELPWCLSTHNRQIDLPEINSAVLISIWDYRNPIVRFWFTAISNAEIKDLFADTSLDKELDDNEKIWKNITKLTEATFGHFPGDKGRDFIKKKSSQTNYKVGLRGKGKNALLFEKDITTLIQNKGTKDESKITLSDKIEILSKNINILSTNSSDRQKPVFADPLFNFMQMQLTLLQTIITILSTSPALAFGVPCAPSPVSGVLVGMFSNLNTQFAQLKQNGKSKYIQIN